MYCSNCGNKVDEKAAVCVKCGVLLNNNPIVSKPSKGKGIASMVLGIIGAFYALIALASLNTAIETITFYENLSEVIGFCIGFGLVQSIFATIAICLSVAERHKNKNGFNTSGFWLSIAIFALVVLQTLILLGSR